MKDSFHKYVPLFPFAITLIATITSVTGGITNYIYDYDFWHYCAITKAFSENLWTPSDPFILKDRLLISPYWLYSLLTGALAQLFDLEPQYFLPVFGVFNLAIYWLGVFALIFATNQKFSCAVWLLFLHSFFWGVQPWLFSGFYHLWVLPFGAPYPATFAFGCALIGTALFAKWRTRRSLLLSFGTWLFGFLTVSSHPISFIFFSVACFSFAVTDKNWRASLSFLTLCGASYVLLLWKFPLFPLETLFVSSDSYVAHHGGLELYQNVLSKIFLPLVFGFTVLFLHRRDKGIIPILVMLVCFAGLYSFGKIVGQWNFGRVVSYLVFILHWLIAFHLSTSFEQTKKPSAIVAAIVVIALILSGQWLLDTQDNRNKNSGLYVQELGELTTLLKQHQPVFTTFRLSRMLPCFGVKPLAYASVPRLIDPSLAEQSLTKDPITEDQIYLFRERFFSSQTSNSEKAEIMKHLKISSILLDRSISHGVEVLLQPHFQLEAQQQHLSVYIERKGGS